MGRVNYPGHEALVFYNESNLNIQHVNWMKKKIIKIHFLSLSPLGARRRTIEWDTSTVELEYRRNIAE